ncbi:MAG: hypothetical protein JO072_15485 [Parafilimonas sp.]|nr:hypothetical protein [Parafilimonas sp.]
MNDTRQGMNNMQMNEHDNMHMLTTPSSFSLNLPMSCNGSGTSWSPAAVSMYGQMYHSQDWMYMRYYNLFIRYNKRYVTNKALVKMKWLMRHTQIGKKGLFRYSTMFSADAIVCKKSNGVESIYKNISPPDENVILIYG